MIAEIRDYIKTTIKEVDSRYFTEDKPFPLEGEVIGTKADYTFHIVFGVASVEMAESGEAFSQISVTLRTYRQGSADKTGTFDEGYCEALLISSKIVDISRLINAQYIQGITNPSVNPIEVDGSQDLYAYESTLNIKISYGIGE